MSNFAIAQSVSGETREESWRLEADHLGFRIADLGLRISSCELQAVRCLLDKTGLNGLKGGNIFKW